MIIRQNIIIALLVTITAGYALSEEYTVERCVNFALENNFDLKSGQYSVMSAREKTKQLSSQYEPVAGLSAGRADPTGSGTSSLYGTSTVKDSVVIDVNKKLKVTGGSMNLKWTNEKTDTDSGFATVNPYYDAGIKLSYSQPFLKNFAGKNDRIAIDISETGEEIADYSPDASYLRDRRRGTVPCPVRNSHGVRTACSHFPYTCHSPVCLHDDG
ncbi:MAG: hypothetical protein ABIH89_10125 [Elusimicrobiota bacterium]